MAVYSSSQVDLALVPATNEKETALQDLLRRDSGYLGYHKRVLHTAGEAHVVLLRPTSGKLGIRWSCEGLDVPVWFHAIEIGTFSDKFLFVTLHWYKTMVETLV